MKKPIEQILPNPHRNFDIYPIGDTQVNILMESIEEVGMFLGLPARKVEDGYEIACGHHRLEALKRAGIPMVDLAVQDYSDEDMLKIMIRENSSQRGNENFGAVLDNVAAVLVECVKDAYKIGNENSRSGGNTPLQVLQNGKGIGKHIIHAKEPALPLASIRAALQTFRATGLYTQLLKKGGLPDEFLPLYDKPQITTIEAVSMFPKPAHAKAWVERVDDDIFQQKVAIERHTNIISDMMKDIKVPLSVSLVRATIIELKNINLGESSPIELPEKELHEKAYDIITMIKSLKKKINKFKQEKENKPCTIPDINTIIEELQENLDWFNNINQEEAKIITI